MGYWEYLDPATKKYVRGYADETIRKRTPNLKWRYKKGIVERFKR